DGADLLDVGLGAGDGGGQLGDDAPLILQLDSNLHGEFAFDVRIPAHGDTLLRVVPDLGDVIASLRVNDHAAAGADVADDRVAGDRVAALGKAHHHALGAANRQGALLGLLGGFRQQIDVVVLRQYRPGDDVCHAIAQADVFQDIVQALAVELQQHLLDLFLRNLLELGAEAAQYLVEQALAQGHGFGVALVLEEVTDVAARLASDHEAEPGRVG